MDTDNVYRSLTDLTCRVMTGDASDCMGSLPSSSVDCIVTSPPYYWQRDYGVDGQIGHEPDIAGFVLALRDAFREARRVLSSEGTLFLNIGDTYYSAKGRPHGSDPKHAARQFARAGLRAVDGPGLGIPRKSLIGMPWRVAFALQEDGWTLRSAVTWERPAPLPEGRVKDRPWRSTEQVFLFSKQSRYWFDRTALEGENEVWRISAQAANPYAHAAPFPIALAERCVRAGCRPGGTVLDPFVGSGTTLLAALKHGRSAVGIDLSPEFADIARRRGREAAHARGEDSERRSDVDLPHGEG